MGFTTSTVGFAAMIDGIDDYVDVELDDDTVYIVGTNVEYAVYQEFGTRHMQPQPYFRPATREAEANMGQIVRGADSPANAVKAVATFIEARSKELAPVDTGRLRGSIRMERVR